MHQKHQYTNATAGEGGSSSGTVDTGNRILWREGRLQEILLKGHTARSRDNPLPSGRGLGPSQRMLHHNFPLRGMDHGGYRRRAGSRHHHMPHPGTPMSFQPDINGYRRPARVRRRPGRPRTRFYEDRPLPYSSSTSSMMDASQCPPDMMRPGRRPCNYMLALSTEDLFVNIY